MGCLRILLLLLSVSTAILCFFADTRLPPQGWGIIFAVVVPALPPLLFMVHALDMLMSLLNAAMPDALKSLHRRVAMINIGIMLMLLLCWLPIFLA